MLTRFLLKLALIGLPWMPFAFALLGIAWHTGEIVPVETMVEWQHKNPQLIFGKASCDDSLQYKVAAYEKRRPRILIFGNSLILFVRSGFFTEQPDTVYNASGPGWVLEHLSAFYDQTDMRPAILILLIDLSWFNGDRDIWSYTRNTLNRQDCNALQVAAHIILSRLAHGKMTLPQMLLRTDPVFDRLSLGLRTYTESRGYRADGSLQIGLRTARFAREAEPKLQNLAPLVAGDARYFPGERLREPAFAALDGLLSRSRADGVTVVGVTPPYHYQIVQKMRERGTYSYMDDAAVRVEALFDSYNYAYHNIVDLRPHGAKHNDWFDSHHLTEAGSLRLMLALFQAHPSLFADYVDVRKVENLLDSYTNGMDIFHELQA